MAATGFTHVSVHARDLEESARFYRDLFGMEEVPAPDFPFPVRWLRVGDLQLHLFLSEDPAPRVHHFGVDVDDFEAVLARAEEIGAREREGYYSGLYELPDGAVQMYLRDPAGNLVEVNRRSAAGLERAVAEGLRKVPGDAALYMV